MLASKVSKKSGSSGAWLCGHTCPCAFKSSSRACVATHLRSSAARAGLLLHKARVLAAFSTAPALPRPECLQQTELRGCALAQPPTKCRQQNATHSQRADAVG